MPWDEEVTDSGGLKARDAETAVLAGSNLVAGKAARVLPGSDFAPHSRGPSGRISRDGALNPGHRPSASALGWALPARWAGVCEALIPPKAPESSGGGRVRGTMPCSPRSGVAAPSHGLRRSGLRARVGEAARLRGLVRPCGRESVRSDPAGGLWEGWSVCLRAQKLAG
jgi:hypothetical protein